MSSSTGVSTDSSKPTRTISELLSHNNNSFDEIQVETIWKGIMPSLLTSEDLSFGFYKNQHIDSLATVNLSVGLHTTYCQHGDHTLHEEASADIYYRSVRKHCVGFSKDGLDLFTTTEGSNENISF